LPTLNSTLKVRAQQQTTDRVDGIEIVPEDYQIKRRGVNLIYTVMWSGVVTVEVSLKHFKLADEALGDIAIENLI